MLYNCVCEPMCINKFDMLKFLFLKFFGGYTNKRVN